MAEIKVHFDGLTIRPKHFDEERGQIVDIIYRMGDEEIYTVENQALGENGLDVNMKVDFTLNPGRMNWLKEVKNLQ